MTEDPRNDQHEAALRQALNRAVGDVTPDPDAMATIRARIDLGEGRQSAPARLRSAAGDARWRLLARTRPGSRSAHAVASSQGLAAGDYVVPGSSAPGAAAGLRSRGRKAAMAVAGVFALLTTGLAVNQLTAADGASSPEAAVRDFFDAVDQEDPLGVLESLSPNERDVLVPSIRRLAEQLERFDVADDGLDLEHVDGLDLQIKDLELRTQGLHPDVASVKVTGGTIVTSANFRELPLGKVLAAALEEEGGRNLDEPLNDSIPLDLTLATVKTGDRWHVSLLYSVAEKMRVDKGAPVPDFGNGIAAKGADSPQGAVDAMVAAFNEQDYTRMIELTPPDTAAVLHDYGPVLLDEGGDDSTVVESIEFGEPKGSGGTHTLTVESYRMVQSYDGEPYSTHDFDGSCLTTTYTPDADDNSEPPPEPSTFCADDSSTGIGLGFRFSPLTTLLFGPGRTEIVVVERDGAWYVDPARSFTETLLVGIEGASPEQINRSVEHWAATSNGDDDAWYATYDASYYENCPGVEAPGPDASFEERKEAGKRCDEELYDGDAVEDEGATATTTVMAQEVACLESSADPAVVEACLQGLGDPEALARFHELTCRASDPAAVEACLQELADTGEIEPSTVAEYRCDVTAQALAGDDREAVAVAWEQCMEDAGFGDGDVDGSTPSTTAPATPTTTG
jgi:hypothetical protein